MSFRIVLLVAVMIQTSHVKGYESCEYAHIMKCDEEFVAGFRTRPNDPDATVYCDVYQVNKRRNTYPVKTSLIKAQMQVIGQQEQ